MLLFVALPRSSFVRKIRTPQFQMFKLKLRLRLYTCRLAFCS